MVLIKLIGYVCISCITSWWSAHQAMRYLTCEDSEEGGSDESGAESHSHTSYNHDDKDTADAGSAQISTNGRRERAWSHSRMDEVSYNSY